MEVGDIFFQMFLCFLVDPLFKVMEVKSIGVLDLSGSQPLVITLKIISNFLTVEDAVDHMTAEQP